MVRRVKFPNQILWNHQNKRNPGIFLSNSFTMVIRFWIFMFRNHSKWANISWHFCKLPSPLSKKILNFDIHKSTPNEREIHWHFHEIPLPWLKKFWILMFLNHPKWKNSDNTSLNSFTMVEKNYEFWCREITQNERI